MSTPLAKPQILLVDDDPEIRDLLCAQLDAHHFSVALADSLAEARRQLANRTFDLMILDLGLGDGDGLNLCREMQGAGVLPVLMLTARADAIDRIIGIEMGADDYVTKPFHPRELIARIRAILRRSAPAQAQPAKAAKILTFADWRLDLVRRELRRGDGALVHLGDAEYDVLLLLVERAQRIVSRDELFQELHGRSPDIEDRSLDLRISRLRRKIESDPKQPALIKTVRTEGFLFTETVKAQ